MAQKLRSGSLIVTDNQTNFKSERENVEINWKIHFFIYEGKKLSKPVCWKVSVHQTLITALAILSVNTCHKVFELLSNESIIMALEEFLTQSALHNYYNPSTVWAFWHCLYFPILSEMW